VVQLPLTCLWLPVVAAVVNASIRHGEGIRGQVEALVVFCHQHRSCLHQVRTASLLAQAARQQLVAMVSLEITQPDLVIQQSEVAGVRVSTGFQKQVEVEAVSAFTLEAEPQLVHLGRGRPQEHTPSVIRPISVALAVAAARVEPVFAGALTT
jgi:hypothetical protein